MNVASRYPTTAVALLFGVVVAVVAAAVLLDEGDAASQRFVLILGVAGTIVTGILGTFRAETATHAARRADEGVKLAASTATRAVTAAVVAAAVEGAKQGNGDVAAAVERALIAADERADMLTRERLDATRPVSDTSA